MARMEFYELNIGSDFSLYGALYRILGIEDTTVTLKNIRTERRFTYGLGALQKILNDAGYTIKETNT